MKKLRFGLIKPIVDAHTMGIYAVGNLLRECGRTVVRATKDIEYAFNYFSEDDNDQKIGEWIVENKIEAMGVSYRLDSDTALLLVSGLYSFLKENGYFIKDGGYLHFLFYAGLPESCEKIKKCVSETILTFKGGEEPERTLARLGIPQTEIPHSVMSIDPYKDELMSYAAQIVNNKDYLKDYPISRKHYSELGTDNDSIEKRIENAKTSHDLPVLRVHFGPFSAKKDREENVQFFLEQSKIIAKDGYIDVLSIGTSQLSQEAFGEDWKDRIDGGGVPLNSPEEFLAVKDAARPMLVRTYAGTKHICNLAKIYEKNLNISWHALSLWWFDELDGRGPNSLYDNLAEHIVTLEYIASCNRAFEANVPHHFAFRGCDDITYIVAGYISAKLAKKKGIKTFILQNMLNTPKYLWGIQDIAKARVMLKLVRELEDDSFQVFLQARAGLDFFKPDVEEAKTQLSYVSCLMDDIEPYNEHSPEIIHVVSYCEAMYLSTPKIIKESAQITRRAISEYRKMKSGHKGKAFIDKYEEDISLRQSKMEEESRYRIKMMEENIGDLYSAKGLYTAFISGWLPTPYLWNEKDEYKYARDYESKMEYGEAVLTKNGVVMTNTEIIRNALNNMEKLGVR